MQGYKHTFDQVEEELDTLDFIESLPENILDDADDDAAEDLCRCLHVPALAMTLLQAKGLPTLVQQSSCTFDLMSNDWADRH